MEPGSEDVNTLFARAVQLAPQGDETGNEYWETIRRLHRRPDRAVFEGAVGLCKGATARERMVGADVLAQLGAGTVDERRPFAAESLPILHKLLTDPVEDVVISAIHALAHLRGAEISTMRQLAAHSSVGIRYAVAHALTNRDEAAAIELLFRLMRDIETNVRDWATFALASQTDFDGPEIRRALTERLGDSDEEVRGEAMVGLSRRGDLAVVDHIVRELDGEPGGLAVDAAEDPGTTPR